MLPKLIQGYRIPARRPYLMDIHHNNGPGARQNFDIVLLDPGVKVRSAVLEDGALAPETDDLGGAIEGVEHDGDAPIARLVDVRDGFVAGTGEVHVPECLLVRDPEVRASLRGDVDMAAATKRGTGYPEPFDMGQRVSGTNSALCIFQLEY